MRDQKTNTIRAALNNLCYDMGWVAGPNASYADAADLILRAISREAPRGALENAAQWLGDSADMAASFSDTLERLGGDPRRQERAAEVANNRSAAAWLQSLAEALIYER